MHVFDHVVHTSMDISSTMSAFANKPVDVILSCTEYTGCDYSIIANKYGYRIIKSITHSATVAFVITNSIHRSVAPRLPLDCVISPECGVLYSPCII